MRKKIVQIVSSLMALLMLTLTGAAALTNQYMNPRASQVIRVGLYYGDTVQNAFTLSHYQGSGYQLGYYDGGNAFIPLAETPAPSVSVAKTWNMYYGTVDRYPSYYTSSTLTSDTMVGCYHLQLPGGYGSYWEAEAAARLQPDGFVAYIGGVYCARFGSYPSREAAQQAAAALGGGYEVGETSSYGVNVVETGTTRILFQYDDQGKGTGLGILPGSAMDSQTAVTWLQSGGSRNVYYGGFRFERIFGEDLAAVNMVQLDDYVKGVVYREMSATWELEALKAQAVCARTYALYHMARQKHGAHHFDLCPTVDCQVYDGVYISGTPEKIERVNRAVDETSGQIMTVNGEVVEALYYSSNGGASEDSGNVWGATLHLVGKEDPYEQTIEIPNYQWTVSYTGEELRAKLIAGGDTGCGVIERVQVTLTDKGNVYSLTFIDQAGKSYTKTKNSCRTFLTLRSLRYTVSGNVSTEVLGGETALVNGGETVNLSEGVYAISGNNSLTQITEGYIITAHGVEQIGHGAKLSGSSASGTVFTFSGAGYGHNVGMSQYGAYAMALQGYTYLDILRFYYTGVTIG